MEAYRSSNMFFYIEILDFLLSIVFSGAERSGEW